MMRPSRRQDAVRLLPGRIGAGLVATVCLAVIASSLVGCGRRGPPMGSLDGTVTVDGAALDRGSVTISRPGVAASGDVDKAGAFRIPPVPTGVYRVGFDSHVPSPEAMANGARHKKLPVHERYRSPATSGIECEIKQGRNTTTFRLSRE